MQDADIRPVLHSYLKKKNNKIKNTIIIDELDLCSGAARIDVAVINGVIHGYEIKSEEDNLKRLLQQIIYYNKTLEKISITTNKLHLSEIKKTVPNWWGLYLVENASKPRIVKIREAKYNKNLEAISLLELLWKDELIALTEKHELEFKKKFNKRILRESISKALPLKVIVQEVRGALKVHQNWRS